MFSQNWVFKASMSTARSYLAATAVDGKIYAIVDTTPP
jgi:hypothetical protein